MWLNNITGSTKVWYESLMILKSLNKRNPASTTLLILTAFYTAQKVIPGEESFTRFLLDLIPRIGHMFNKIYVSAYASPSYYGWDYKLRGWDVSVGRESRDIWRYREFIERHGTFNIHVERFIPPYTLSRIGRILNTFYDSYSIFLAIIRTLCLILRHLKELHNSNRVVIYAQSVSLLSAAILTSLFLRACKVKADVIITLHNVFLFRNKNRFLRNIFRVLFTYFVKKVSCISYKIRDELITIGIPKYKVIITRYQIDFDKFPMINKIEAKKSLGLYPSEFVVLFIGRLIPEKGVRVLLAIAQNLDRTIKNLKILVGGDGPLRSEVMSSKYINYRGFIPGDKVSLYLNAADIVVVPSLFEEGLGRIVMESLACGTPVIGSRRGGIPELLDEKFLIEPKPIELYEKILELYQFLNKLGQQGLENFRSMLRNHIIKIVREEGDYGRIFS